MITVANDRNLVYEKQQMEKALEAKMEICKMCKDLTKTLDHQQAHINFDLLVVKHLTELNSTLRGTESSIQKLITQLETYMTRVTQP